MKRALLVLFLPRRLPHALPPGPAPGSRRATKTQVLLEVTARSRSEQAARHPA